MRYRHQVHELNMPLNPGDERVPQQAVEQACDRFDKLYEQTYGPGAGYREAGKEIMVFRVTATGRTLIPGGRAGLATPGRSPQRCGARSCYVGIRVSG